MYWTFLWMWIQLWPWPLRSFIVWILFHLLEWCWLLCSVWSQHPALQKSDHIEVSSAGILNSIVQDTNKYQNAQVVSRFYLRNDTVSIIMILLFLQTTWKPIGQSPYSNPHPQIKLLGVWPPYPFTILIKQVPVVILE